MFGRGCELGIVAHTTLLAQPTNDCISHLIQTVCVCVCVCVCVYKYGGMLHQIWQDYIVQYHL